MNKPFKPPRVIAEQFRHYEGRDVIPDMVQVLGANTRAWQRTDIVKWWRAKQKEEANV